MTLYTNIAPQMRDYLLGTYPTYDSFKNGLTSQYRSVTSDPNVGASLQQSLDNLRVWRDLDQDGKTDTGELFTLTQLGINSINLNATTVDQTIAGNKITAESTYTKTDGTTRKIVAPPDSKLYTNLSTKEECHA